MVDGLEVLVRQGALSFQAWTGLEAPIDVMRDSARATSPTPMTPEPATHLTAVPPIPGAPVG